jgi:hypothetical protein
MIHDMFFQKNNAFKNKGFFSCLLLVFDAWVSGKIQDVYPKGGEGFAQNSVKYHELINTLFT